MYGGDCNRTDFATCKASSSKLCARLPLLKPGGILVYSTCSLEPEENEEVVTNLLSNFRFCAWSEKAIAAVSGWFRRRFRAQTGSSSETERASCCIQRPVES